MTTQSMTKPPLLAEVGEDQMETGVSPYVPAEDSDLDLEDPIENYIEDNSMIDEATDAADVMQADNSTNHQDDIMYDEDIIDFEDDFDMNAAAHEDVPTAVTDAQEEIQESLSIVLDDDNKHSLSEQNVAPQELSADNFEQELEDEDQQEEELVDEWQEEDANQEQANNPVSEMYTEATQAMNDVSEETHTTAIAHSVTEHPDLLPQTSTEEAHVTEDLYDSLHEEANELQSHHDVEDDLTAGPGTENPTQEEAEDGETILNHEEAISGLTNATPSQLHPCLVEYAGEPFHLFPLPDDDSAEPLLQDSSLAFKPINDLLQQLHGPFAEYLGHSDEIVLDIPSLGLHICEDSKYSFELTLAQIIDTYMLLSQNQQLANIDPLYCQLSHRVCLRTQMNYLGSSAREGKTYATIVEEHVVFSEVAATEETGEAGEEAYDETTQYYDTADTTQPEGQADEQVHVDLDVTTVEYDLDADEDAQTHLDGSVPHQGAEGARQIPTESEQDDLNGPSHEEDFTAGDNTHGNDHSTETKIGDNHDLPHVTTNDVNETLSQHVTKAEHSHDDHVKQTHSADIEYEDIFADLEKPSTAKSLGTAPGGTELKDPRTTASAVEDDLFFDDWDSDKEPEPAPITPSKIAPSKRKMAEDDDDFLLDLSTPEPKRTRPS
ncbi:hypothetical protein LTR51_004432 [Lithohypha guttulata]|nr:hypothetical protein LTR51_004432 [Lithohypha guttulata]